VYEADQLTPIHDVSEHKTRMRHVNVSNVNQVWRAFYDALCSSLCRRLSSTRFLHPDGWAWSETDVVSVAARRPDSSVFDATISRRIERALAVTDNARPSPCSGKTYRQWVDEQQSSDAAIDLSSSSLWTRFVANVSTCALYEEGGEMDKILDAMANETIVELG